MGYPQYPGYGHSIQGQAYGQPVQGQPIYVQPSGQPYGPPQGNTQLPPAYSSIALDASPRNDHKLPYFPIYIKSNY